MSFIGLDSVTYAPDRPVDAWLDQSMAENAKHVSAMRRACSQGFYAHHTDTTNNNTGHRPYAAVGWQTVTVFDIWLEPGVIGVTVDGVYNVQSEGATQSDVDARLTIDGFDEDDQFTLSNTDAAGSASFGDFSNTWTFNQPYAGRPRWARLAFFVKSQDGGTASISVTLSGDGFPYTTAANGDLANVTNGPTTGSLEVAYAGDSIGRAADILSMDPQTTNPERLYVHPKNFFYTASAVGLHYLSYVQFRSIGFSVDYAQTAYFRGIRSNYQSKKPVRGIDEIEHALASDAMGKRPRIIAWGPTGYALTADEQWADDYCKLWRYEQGDASGMDLIDSSVLIDRDNPTIRLRAYMISTLFGGGDVDPGEIDWTFTFSAKQLDDLDTSWASATTIATKTTPVVTMPVWPTLIYGRSQNIYRYTRLQHLLHDYGDSASGTPSNYAWVYREGTLIEDDFPLLFPVDILLDLSSFTTRQLNGVRMQLSAAYSASRNLPWASSSATSRIRVACVGWSMWIDNE